MGLKRKNKEKKWMPKRKKNKKNCITLQQKRNFTQNNYNGPILTMQS